MTAAGAGALVWSIIDTVNGYPKRKRFNIHNPYRFSGGYLLSVFSDYSPRKVMDWFLQAGAYVVEVQTVEDSAGVTEFYIEVSE